MKMNLMKKSRLAKQLLATLACGVFMAMNGDVSLANAALDRIEKFF